MSKLNLIKEIERLSINEDEYDDYESNKMSQEVAVAKMFTRLAKQGRDPIDMISHRFGWSTHELDDLAQQLGFKNAAEWMNSFKRGVAEGYKEPTDAAGHAKMAAKIKKMLDDTLADSGDRHGNPDLQRLVRAYEYHMEKAKEKSKGVTEAKNPEEFISSISKIDPSFAKKEPAIFSRGETVEIKSEREASQDYGRYFGELAMVMVDSKDCITKRTKDGSKYKMIPVKIFNDHAEIRVSSRDLKPFTMDSFYHGVTEDSKAPAFNWASWDPDNYESGSPEYYSSLSNAILSLVKEKFGGKAWFDGGGYAYLIDVSNPKKLVSSDGADINVPNVARGLEKYTSNFKENFVDVYPSDWPDFFRSTRKTPGPESDQEWYELGKMGIGVRENSHKLSGQGVAEGSLEEVDTRTLVNYVPKAGRTLASLPPEERKRRSGMMTRAYQKLIPRPDFSDEIKKYQDGKNKKQGVAEGLNEAKTKTKTKPDISDTFKQKPDQPLTKKDDKKAEKPKDEPKGETPKFKVSSKDETLKKTAGIRMNDRAAELLSKMKDVEADPDDPGYPKHETLPSTNVKPDNVPAVINKAMTVKGFLNPEWHIVANLPGNMATAIRTVGRKLFKSFTRTPTDKIVMIGNVMNHGPNTNAEINAVAKWLKNAGQEVSSGDVDFSDFMPGYKADIKMYDAAGCRFLLVEDFAGRYVYVWPHNDSVTMSNAPQLTKEDINIIKEAELRFRTLAGL